MFKFFKVPVPSDENAGALNFEPNRLQKYIQAQSTQDISQLTSEISTEVKNMIGLNVQALMGYLPSSEFNMTIMSSKESLQNLLASAMLTGYFIHAMEYRMLMDELFDKNNSASNPLPKSEPVEPQTHLQSPETLFQQQNPVANTETAGRPSEGQFLSKPELLKQLENPVDFNVQVEVNTNFDLESFLEEFQFLQGRDNTDSKEK